MRKFVPVLLIALALAVTLAGCGTTPAPTATDPTATATAEAAADAAAATEPTQAPAEAAAEPPAAAPTDAPATVAAEEPTAAPTQEPIAEPTAAPVRGVTLPEVNPLEVTGDITAAGSSTVFPLSERTAERFQDEGYSGNITIDSIGSGAGFERFCARETDISNASRAIKDSEVETCRANGIEPVEIRVGTDALAIVVSQENDFITNATLAELATIFSADATKWSDVNPAWPAEDILRFIPGTDSGTFDYFVEVVFEKDKERALNAPNQQLSEDDNVFVQGVLGSSYAIGYFGYAYYAENADTLRVLSIEGVAPSDQAVDDGSYPLACPLFMYASADIMASKPQVASFISFYLTFVNEEIGTVGYFPASPEALDIAKQSFLEAAGG